LAIALLIASYATPLLAAASDFDLADLRWQSRPLILFATSAEDPTITAFRAGLSVVESELRERAVVLIEVVGADQASLDGTALPEGTAEALRRRYQVPGEARMLILVGKDGGEKLRTPERWDLDEVFALIDGMPMRQRELRERGGDPGASGAKRD